jgi:hypothetical protein
VLGIQISLVLLLDGKNGAFLGAKLANHLSETSLKLVV